MIAFLDGQIALLYADGCVINVSGVGYRVYTPLSTRSKLQSGARVRLHTCLVVRDDGMTLYGFVTEEERNLFSQLMAVSGIGPRMALNILSALAPVEFKAAVVQQNVATLTLVPGIGKKTAQRIILELKDKFAVAGTAGETAPAAVSDTDLVHDALVSLGYAPAEAAAVLRRLPTDGTVEERVRLALKELATRR